MRTRGDVSDVEPVAYVGAGALDLPPDLRYWFSEVQTERDWRMAFASFSETLLGDLLGREPRTFAYWNEFPATRDFEDAIGLNVQSGRTRAIVFSFLRRRAAWRASAWRDARRMRRQLATVFDARVRATSPDTADAVLAPDGRLLHVGRSLGRDGAELLSAAVRTLERERLAHESADEGERLWDELLAGRWSVVEHLDRDGKRTLLLARTDGTDGALSPEEVDLLARLERGHSVKQISLDYRLAPSTVSERIGAAIGKLGFRTRAEYLRFAPRRRRR